MSSVDLEFCVSSCKCFNVEKTFSTYARLQRIENEKEMNLCRLGEGVRLTDKSSVHKIQIIAVLLSLMNNQKSLVF
jgi:hypothetical protein